MTRWSREQGGGSAEEFLQAMNKQNEAIAAREAKKVEDIPPDEIRIQRDQERREKYGQLRAREHPTRQPSRVKRVYN